jgi:hypothetical protein
LVKILRDLRISRAGYDRRTINFVDRQ